MRALPPLLCRPPIVGRPSIYEMLNVRLAVVPLPVFRAWQCLVNMVAASYGDLLTLGGTVPASKVRSNMHVPVCR